MRFPTVPEPDSVKPTLVKTALNHNSAPLIILLCTGDINDSVNPRPVGGVNMTPQYSSLDSSQTEASRVTKLSRPFRASIRYRQKKIIPLKSTAFDKVALADSKKPFLF